MSVLSVSVLLCNRTDCKNVCKQKHSMLDRNNAVLLIADIVAISFIGVIPLNIYVNVISLLNLYSRVLFCKHIRNHLQ